MPHGTPKNRRGRSMLVAATFAALAAWIATGPAARLAFASQAEATEAGYRDDHESNSTAWKAAGADTRVRVEDHARVPNLPRSGGRCEQLAVSTGIGSFAYFSHSIGQARIIDELRPSVWVRANRAGLQCLAQVVLPRTVDPKTGRAVTFLVRGETYNQVGQWQQLAIAGFPTAVEQHVRALRAQLGAAVDPREAYVDQVLVNVYVGRGSIKLWLDDLEVAGFVGRRPEQQDSDVPITPLPAAADPDAQVKRRVELRGDVLLVGQRPFLPRMIDYRGEPLGELAELGFNAIWLRKSPTVELLNDARVARLWVICPPPDPLPAELGGDYDGVLAWNLGHHLSAAEFDAAAALAEVVRRRDPNGRPLVGHADSQLRGYSRIFDILLVDRPVLGTSLEMADYVRLLGERPRLARPGTPVWTAIELDFDPRAAAQISALASRPIANPSFAADQIRQVAFTATAAGARGLLFTTQRPLPLYERQNGRSFASSAAADHRVVLSHRAMALALVNRELAMCEPWLTEGQHAAATTDEKRQIAATVVESRRGKLLVATRALPGGQFAPGAHPTGDVTLIAPGVAETQHAFEISPAGLRTLGVRRVAGGSHLSWDRFGGSGCAVLTADSLLVTNLNRQAAANIRQTAAFQLALARRTLADCQRLTGSQAGLPENGPAEKRGLFADDSLVAAEQLIRQAERQFAAADAAASFASSRRACDAAAHWQRAQWEKAVRGWSSPVACPLAISTEFLVEQREFDRRLVGAVIGRNSLDGGDCENLSAMTSAGWRHFEHGTPGVETRVELSPGAPFAGASSLRISAASQDSPDAAQVIETPPVWVVTAPVQFAADAVVRLRCRVRGPEPITGSYDGLMIIDSLGGRMLAARVGHTTGWQEYTAFRHARRDEPVTLTFALTGIGEAWIDNVVVEPVALPPAANTRPGPIASSKSDRAAKE